MPAQRINGFFYSWSSIELKIQGETFWGFTAIDYGDDTTRGEVRGSGARIEGTTRGQYKPSCEITFLREEWDRLLEWIDARAGYSIASIDATVSYAERGVGAVTDRIRGIHLTKPSTANAQGATATTVKVGCDCDLIEWGNGRIVAVVEKDADFFLGGEGNLYASNPVDTVIIAGDKLPGICKVKGLPQLEVDKKKAKGSKATAITVGGYLPGPIEIECMVWTRAQWDELKRIGRALWNQPNKGSDQKAVTIYHPWLDLWGVNTITIVGVGVPEPGSAPQSVAVPIKAIEWKPPEKKTAVKTPKQPKANQVDPHKAKPANSAITPPGSDAQYMTPAGR